MNTTGNLPPIQPMTRCDALEVARLHMSGLPSPMGARAGRALLEMYYACVAPKNGGMGFVACDQGQVVGFVVGVWDRRRILWTALRRFPLRFVFWMSVEFGWNRTCACLRRRRRKNDTGEDGTTISTPVGCELRPLVVAATQRGRGLGALLCGRLLEEAAARGFYTVFLRVDRENVAAIRCYEKLGFRARGAGSHWMVRAADIGARPAQR